MFMKSSELLQLSHNHVNGYIKSADQKASILLGGLLTFLGLFLNIIDNVWSQLEVLTQFFIGLSVACVIITIGLLSLVISPRVGGEIKKGYIYWGNILEHNNKDEFVDEVSGLDDSDITSELGEEVYSVSRIADVKYKWLNRALLSTVISFVIGLIASYLFFF